MNWFTWKQHQKLFITLAVLLGLFTLVWLYRWASIFWHTPSICTF